MTLPPPKPKGEVARYAENVRCRRTIRARSRPLYPHSGCCLPLALRSYPPLAGCGKSRDFEKMAMERARYRNEGRIRSMAYGRAPGDEWQRNDDQSTFSASC